MSAERISPAGGAGGHRSGRSWLGAVVGGLNAGGAAIILFLMALINADVIARNLLNAPIPGVVELTEAGIVMLVFLQVGHTLRVNRFMRSDGFFSMVARRKPRAAAAMGLVFNLTGAVLFVLVCYAVEERVIEAWFGGYYKGIRGAFTFPVWPIELTMFIGSAMMVLQFSAFAIRDVKMLARRDVA